MFGFTRKERSEDVSDTIVDKDLKTKDLRKKDNA
jgi:hypothetical protein